MLLAEIKIFFRAFIALFIITDILGNLPIFIGLTEDETKEERRRTFTIAIITAFVLLLLFTFAGRGILALFHITLSDFKIAGGILLLAIALTLLIRRELLIHHDETMGAVPLGCPLLTGPGAITTALVLLGDYGVGVTFTAVVACFAANWVILLFAENIYEALGKRGTGIISKIISILIAAIAVQFIREGIISLIQ